MVIENSITYLLTKITNQFKVKLDKHLKEIGLHGGQVFILFELWRADGQSQVSLAEALGVSPPTINKMIKSLCEGEFVYSQKCETDGRLMKIHLTRKGTDCRSDIETQWQKMELQFFSNLNETEKLIFMQILNKLKN